MARRASSSAHPVWILITVALLAAAVGGGFMLSGRSSDPYRTMTVFPVRDYLENANSLRGNSYKMDATITAAIEYSGSSGRATGRLFSMQIGDDVVAVLVPADFNHINIERGQRYLLKIEVGDKGIIRALEIKKA